MPLFLCYVWCGQDFVCCWALWGVCKSGRSGSSLKENKIQKLEEQGINVHGESEWMMDGLYKVKRVFFSLFITSFGNASFDVWWALIWWVATAFTILLILMASDSIVCPIRVSLTCILMHTYMSHSQLLLQYNSIFSLHDMTGDTEDATTPSLFLFIWLGSLIHHLIFFSASHLELRY